MAEQATSWFDRLASYAAIDALIDQVGHGGGLSAQGVWGSSTVLATAAMRARLNQPMVLVTAHLDDADEAVDELAGLGVKATRLPAIELAPGQDAAGLDQVAERLVIVRRLLDGDVPEVLIAPIHALMQAVPDAAQLARMLRVIKPGDPLSQGDLVRWLDGAGYRRVDSLESPGEFAVRGGIVDICLPGSAAVRLDFFGDEVESLHAVDLESMGSDRRLSQVEIAGATATAFQQEDLRNIADLLPETCVTILAELIEIQEQGRSYFDRAGDARGVFSPQAVLAGLQRRCAAVIDVNQYGAGAFPERRIVLPVQALPTFSENVHEAFGEVVELARRSRAVVLCQTPGEAQRTKELLDEAAGKDAARPEIGIEVRYVHRGFIWGDEGAEDSKDGHAADGRPLAVIPHHEIVHRYQTRRRIRQIAASGSASAGEAGSGGRALDTFVDLQTGDYVVHRDHGIARFAGLKTMQTPGGDGSEEFLTLEFAGRAKLHVPASRIELVQKYIGGFRGAPELSTMGGRKWANQKQRVSEAVKDLAAEMLRLQAARESMPGIRYPADTPWQHEFDAEFPYDETPDQTAAIASVKRDMVDLRPMDRLVCGDVGFGKTEVAMRGAFKAAEYGKQVAVLVPTTVLAEQHERTFRERFADYPFRIESLSRFKTGAEQDAVVKSLSAGQVDVVIGTHRLLSGDVKFSDLGLVVIDEEQRFGVEHKQKLLAFRATADVLTLSATPIPRTLHMALLGLRDISSLTTAPQDRRAIVTEVIAPDRSRIRRALVRELAREGQAYYVHNRVHDIKSVADDVQALVPDARVIIGHGQMAPRELEAVMLKFVRHEADILVSTTIIESGLDIPNANTIIINNAHAFGLSELHQLRGRVGRWKHRAYCYLVLPRDRTISEVAAKRLKAVESFSMLGAGFKIALKDLELRGAGNLLGPEQSGHIAAVGYEMYCQLLEQAVEDLKHNRRTAVAPAVVDLGISGAIPRGYIPSDARRMDAYRRIARAVDAEALARVRHDLESAYGAVPRSTDVLLQLAEIRIGASALGVTSLARHEMDIVFKARRPAELEAAMKGAKGSLRFVGQPDDDGLIEVYYRPPATYFEDQTLLSVLRKRLGVGSLAIDEHGNEAAITNSKSVSAGDGRDTSRSLHSRR